MVNLDNIFHLFESNDDLDGTENSTTLIDFKNTPTYWVGMYKNEEHIKGAQNYADEYLDTALKLGINFFIETEQYERCAHLQKILNNLSE